MVLGPGAHSERSERGRWGPLNTVKLNDQTPYVGSREKLLANENSRLRRGIAAIVLYIMSDDGPRRLID